MLDQAFADIGLAFSQMLGGPYHVAQTIEQTDPVYDDGGSIVTPGSVVHRSCSVQIDVATQAMRELRAMWTPMSGLSSSPLGPMTNDLLRATERAAIISLKADAPPAHIVAKTSIDPVAEAPTWPVVRLGGTQSLPQGRGCTARVEVSFQLHSFAKPIYNGAGAMTKTARDHAGDVNTAVVEALHNHAFEVSGRRYRFQVQSSRLMPDGDEKDAYYGIAFVRARAFQG